MEGSYVAIPRRQRRLPPPCRSIRCGSVARFWSLESAICCYAATTMHREDRRPGYMPASPVRGTIISGSTADSSICCRRDGRHRFRRPSVARGSIVEGLSAADGPGAGEAERIRARPLRCDARCMCGRARRLRRQREHGHNRRRDI